MRTYRFDRIRTCVILKFRLKLLILIISGKSQLKIVNGVWRNRKIIVGQMSIAATNYDDI